MSQTPGNFVHLHVHSDHSALDSVAQMAPLCAAAVADGQPAVAATDHGSVSGLYRLRSEAKKQGIKYIAGMEAYLAYGSRFDRTAGLGPAGDVDPDSLDADKSLPTIDAREPDPDAEPGPDPSVDATAGSASMLEGAAAVAGRQTDAPNSADEPGGSAKTKPYMHLTILARDHTGWLNLVKLHNASYASVWFKPRIDLDLLAQHGEGLIVLTGCIGGPVAGPLSRGDVALADANTERLIAAVGRENVYVEVMEHGNDVETENLPRLYEHAERHELKVVATNDCHYVHPGQHTVHDAWLCVSTKAAISDEKRFRFHGDGYHLRTGAEMRALRPDDPRWQAACDETVRLAERVEDDVIGELPTGLPHVRLPEGWTDSTAYLKHLVGQGALRRYADRLDADGRLPKEIRDRLAYEFKVVVDSGYPDYFLIVHDLIEWANSDRGLPTPEHPDGEPATYDARGNLITGKKPILTGPGRGSAAGAVLSYCLGIVGVDPLRYDLLFERFLEPGRVGMPDIDLDFERGRRGEVLAYLSARYGEDCVAQIGNFGFSRSKAAIKDATRVLGLPVHLGEQLAAHVPLNAKDNAKPYRLSVLMDATDEVGREVGAPLREAVAESEDAKSILELALGFEDAVRQLGIHACGVLITAEPLESIGVPLRWNWDAANQCKKGLPITAWDGTDVGDDGAGMLKLDVLGLRTLDLMAAAVANIEEATGEKIDLISTNNGAPSPHVVPDPEDHENPRVNAAWALLGEGKTSSVFQLESTGISSLTEDVAPHSLHDLSAILALYRPGPMGANSHRDYVSRRANGPDYSKWTSDPDEQRRIHEVLAPTYGVLTYQEQIMALGTVVGGMDVQQRSVLRKAVAKKKEKVLKQSEADFFAGCEQRVVDEQGNVVSEPFSRQTAERLWADFKDMGSYAFNASHSVAYAQVAYLTAYLKANWPAEYAAGVLTTTESGEKRDEVMQRIVKEGISVVAPTVNKAKVNASAVASESGQPTVMLGLSEIKGMSEAARQVVAERTRNGEFASPEDLKQRVSVPESVIEALCFAGAIEAAGGAGMVRMRSRGVRTLAS